MSFKDGGWAQRFGALGDEAEGVFEGVCADVLDLNFVRIGLSRPPLQVHKLPARERYRPDYLMSSKYVEVQGLGRDQKVKMKWDKLMSLHFWDSIYPVEMFLWDSHHRRWCFVNLAQFDALLASHGKLGMFQEGKSYIELGADHVFEAAEQVGEVA